MPEEYRTLAIGFATVIFIVVVVWSVIVWSEDK